MKVSLVGCTLAPLKTIATAAAITRGVLYDDFDMSRAETERLVRQCYESGHWSVFEFADFDFEVEGASRVFETQAVRSRMSSYEWETGRRDQEYEPIQDIGAHLQLFIENAIKKYENYVHVWDHTPEEARYIIPQGVARKGRIKKNFRNLLETAEVRLCQKTQAEYRDFMMQVKELVTDVDPFLSSLLQPKCKRLMYCNETEGCGAYLSKEIAKKLIL